MSYAMVLESGSVSAVVYDVAPVLDHYLMAGLNPKCLEGVNEFTYAALPEGSHGRFLVRANDIVDMAEGDQVKLTITGNLETFVHKNLFIKKITFLSVTSDAWTLSPGILRDRKLAIVEVQDMWFPFNQTVRKDYNRVTVFNPINTGNSTEPTAGGLGSMQDILDDLATTFGVLGTPTVQISGFPTVKPRNLLLAGCSTPDAFQFIADSYLLVCYVDRQTDSAGKIIFSDDQPSTIFAYTENREILFNYGSETLPSKLRMVVSQQGHPFSRERSTVLSPYYSTYNLDWANSSKDLVAVNDPILSNNDRFTHASIEYAHYFPFYENSDFNNFNSDCTTILDTLAINLVKRTLRSVEIVLKDIRVLDPCMTIQKIKYKLTRIGLTTTLLSEPPNPVQIPPITNQVARGMEYVPPMVSGYIGTESGADPLGGDAPNTACNFWLDDLGGGALNIPVFNNTTQQTFEDDQTFAVFNIHTRRFEKIERFTRFFQYTLITDWAGGIAIAYRFSMDGVPSGKKVLLRDPLSIFSYQKRGDSGYMVYTEEDAFYAIQAPCNVGTPSPITDPTGACCYGSYCVVSTAADCSMYGTYKGNGTTCSPNPCGD